MKRLHAIGFWRSDDSPITLVRFPHPRELIDPGWDQEERGAVAAYLAGGVSVRGYFGFSHCRFSDGPPDDEMGTDDLSDRQYVWPQGLPIYVARYAVQLPKEFLDHVRSQAYQVPTDLDGEALGKRKYSYKLWERWVRRHRSNRFLALLSWVV